MARCGDCNKFVGFEEQDPDVETVDYDAGSIRATVRIVNACAECGTELREASLEMEAEAPEGWDDHDPDQHVGEDAWDTDAHELTAEESDAERTSRRDGSGRRAPMFYGAKLTVTLACKCGWSADVELEDDVQASAMDEV